METSAHLRLPAARSAITARAAATPEAQVCNGASADDGPAGSKTLNRRARGAQSAKEREPSGRGDPRPSDRRPATPSRFWMLGRYDQLSADNQRTGAWQNGLIEKESDA